MIPKPTKLIDVLESNPDPKYNLSPKACAGILGRAERRGKKLPKILETALRSQADLLDESLTDISEENICQGVDLYNQTVTGEVSKTLNAISSDADHVPCIVFTQNQRMDDPCHALINDSRNYVVTNKAYGLDTYNQTMEEEVAQPIRSAEGGDCKPKVLISDKYVVRRLTPLECERLQDFPDHWTNIGEWIDSKGKKHKNADSPRYKALGNSIALPFWKHLLDKISAKYNNQGTLGSLFSGIGGFDLCWEQTNGKGSCIWQSDIEEFCIAVCKKHFIDQN